VAFWLDKMKQHHWRARYDATQALARMGWEAMGAQASKVRAALLWRLRHDENFWVRQGAARAMGRLGRGVLALVRAMRQDPRAEVRNDAAKALGAIAARGGQPLMEGHAATVMAALRKARKDKAIRWTAARTWELLTGDPQPLVAVMMLDLRTRNRTVRGLVARSFGKLSMRAKAQAVVALVAALRRASGTTTFIEGALISIGKMAIPAVKRATRHKSAKVRAAAARVLRRLQAAKR